MSRSCNGATGFSNGNMSLHLSKLEAAGLITIHEDFVRKRPQTRAEWRSNTRRVDHRGVCCGAEHEAFAVVQRIKEARRDLYAS